MRIEEKERLKMALADNSSRSGRTEPEEPRAGVSVDTVWLLHRVCASWPLTEILSKEPSERGRSWN